MQTLNEETDLNAYQLIEMRENLTSALMSLKYNFIEKSLIEDIKLNSFRGSQ